MKNSFKKTVMVGTMLLGILSGCASTGVSNTPATANDGLPMSQVDTENKVSSLCNDVLMQSGTVSSSVTEYLYSQAEYSDDRISALTETIKTARTETEKIQTESETYRPAQVLEDKNSKLKNKIKDIVKDLDAMENAIKAGDTDAVKSIYSAYSSDLDVIRSLAS